MTFLYANCVFNPNGPNAWSEHRKGGVINVCSLSGETEEPVKHIQPGAHVSLAISDTPQVIAVGCGP